MPNAFGSAHTEEKLQKLEAYLKCFTQVLKFQPFKLVYFDAFAGTPDIDVGDTGSPLLGAADIVPGIRQASDSHDRHLCIHSVTDLVDSAAKLSDAIGRLRGTAPGPEIRQRITVERVQKLAGPETEA